MELRHVGFGENTNKKFILNVCCAFPKEDGNKTWS
jgi:hypothetical protein